jgi:hypothetical protein
MALHNALHAASHGLSGIDDLSYPRPNILINSNGASPINQRGVADGGALATGDYTIDRWFVTDDATGVAFENSGGGSGIKLTDVTDGTVATFAQMVESFAQYKGKTVTLTMSVVANNACTIYIADGVGTTSSAAHSGSGTETLTVTRTIDASATKLEVGISVVIALNNYAEFVWAKLEEGSVATAYQIPDPATELARCQRYYQRITTGTSEFGLFAKGYAYSATNATLMVDLPTPINKAPSISANSISNIAIRGAGGTHTPSNLSLDPVSCVTNGDDYISIAINMTSTGYAIYETYIALWTGTADYIDINAEL